MPVTRRTRTLSASPQAVWDVLADPHHMPRWWPEVVRMEGVEHDRWTQVFRTRRGHTVRADFRLLASDPPSSRSWEQEVVGTPFERVLRASVVEVSLAPAEAEGTEVTIAQRQTLRGYSRTGGFLLRSATRAKLDEALAGLARICDER